MAHFLDCCCMVRFLFHGEICVSVPPPDRKLEPICALAHYQDKAEGFL